MPLDLGEAFLLSVVLSLLTSVHPSGIRLQCEHPERKAAAICGSSSPSGSRFHSSLGLLFGVPPPPSSSSSQNRIQFFFSSAPFATLCKDPSSLSSSLRLPSPSSFSPSTRPSLPPRLFLSNDFCFLHSNQFVCLSSELFAYVPLSLSLSLSLLIFLFLLSIFSSVCVRACQGRQVYVRGQICTYTMSMQTIPTLLFR